MDLIKCLIMLRESNGGDSALQKFSYPAFEISLKKNSCTFPSHEPPASPVHAF